MENSCQKLIAEILRNREKKTKQETHISFWADPSNSIPLIFLRDEKLKKAILN